MRERTPSDSDIRSNYEFDYAKAKRNRFAGDYHVSVTLDSDVAEVFKDSKSVNTALRAFIAAMPKSENNSKAPNPVD